MTYSGSNLEAKLTRLFKDLYKQSGTMAN